MATRMAAPRSLRALAFGACALALALPSPARCAAQGIEPGAFAAPILDGVRLEAGPPATLAAGPDIKPYRFLGQTDWPAIRLHASRALDWSHSDALTLGAENPADTPFELLIRLDDTPDANGDERSLTGTVTLAPHEHATLVMPLDSRPLGMLARPPGAAAAGAGERLIGDVRGSVDLHHIMALHISGVRTDADHVVRLGTAALRGTGTRLAAQAIVDGFGQALAGTWPEKVASTAQLRTRLHEADTQTRQLLKTALRAADAFGGVDPATRLPATGFFRTVKTDGRWSLVTPTGHRFFSIGADGVAPANPTRIAGRAWMFTGLPAGSNPLARHYGPETPGGGPETYDFGGANLERGLGPDWLSRWPGATLQRLRGWGFNTLGNWSSEPAAGSPSMPYVTFYDFEGDTATLAMPGGRNLPDPFDPRFAAVADEVARTMTETRRNDPYLLGYFSGNELPWGTADRPDQGIAAHVLALGPESPAKQALVQDLQSRYASPRAFATAWGLAAPADWADLLDRPLAWPPRLTASARQDIETFQGRFAELYFRTVRQAIKRRDPNHLYLGTRFANYTPEIVDACARWCDVLSFNVYGRTPEGEAAAWRRLDRPVLIGEFHFGSADRGPFWPGMVDVGAEAARGPAYAAYVAAAVEDPAIVGCHWFRYADEPATGVPYDGENGHIGLVGITDIPFADFVAAVAAANRRTLETFAAQGHPALRGTR